jgi:hypothetical protein
MIKLNCLSSLSGNFHHEIAVQTTVYSSMSMTDKILLRHSISGHQIVSAKLHDLYNGCASLRD